MKKEIPASEEIPNGYGIAYYQAAKDTYLCYPIPLNVAVSLFYLVKLCFKFAFLKAQRKLEKVISKDLR